MVAGIASVSPSRTTVLHAAWTGGRLLLWAEDGQGWLDGPRAGASPADASSHHTFAASIDSLQQVIDAAELIGTDLVLRLPASAGHPIPSASLVALLSVAPPSHDSAIATITVPAVAIPADRAGAILESLLDRFADSPEEEAPGAGRVALSSSVHFFASAARLARHLVVQQRFVPMLEQLGSGELLGRWMPWTSDEATAERVGKLVRAMPAEARAAVDEHTHDPERIVEDCLTSLVDGFCRAAFRSEDLADAVREKDPGSDLQVAWLRGLLDAADAVPAGNAPARQDLVKRVRTWISGLEDRGQSSAWRLCLRLNDPAVEAPPAKKSGPSIDDAADTEWDLSFHLQSLERPTLVLDAEDLWVLSGQSVTIEGKRVDTPQELLLAELGRASKIYPKLESALDEAQPTKLELSTKQAYEFLREVRPVLLEQGFGVQSPSWWDSPAARLGARLRLEGVDGGGPGGARPGSTAAAGPQLGLGTLVKYKWEIAVGDVSLSLHEFEQLASRKSPLVRINGRWVEVRPEDVQAAIRFIRENPGGQMHVGEALRMAYAADLKQTGIPVVGLEAEGWLSALLGGDAQRQLEVLPTPGTFQGTLRPYQIRGMSWLEFLERVGLGACLADDMGLGKTIQLLALLAREREEAAASATAGLGASAPAVQPTLLVVPMSVVGNWIHESRRFCPHLKVLVHHGPGRLDGQNLIDTASASDLVITTYALAYRDQDKLQQVKWGRIVLDEAQYIKNPQAKQSQAVRAIDAPRRVALTGTPVENRLSELWSIMDFLNPGFLGTAGNFRSRFGVPIERYHDRNRAEQLRGLIRPFVLRRLKTDPTVVADLPEKIESREFSHLTSEQASLYEACVRRMLGEVENSEGVHRRGLVLAALIRLKQICNHPSQVLHDAGEDTGKAPDPSRSGKCMRILEMLDEVLSEGDQALVFTQFRQMGGMLTTMIRQRTGRDVLFLHGGTTQQQRQELIESFQKADGRHPVLVLSLRAGGVGLNLTAATHVFHFDRWWNPAVENQATDRAYRIGQTRTVQVHKFVVRGTLEERIDEMIEQKTELAMNIIGAGERWLTELSTDQLRDILTLRDDAVGDDA